MGHEGAKWGWAAVVEQLGEPVEGAEERRATQLEVSHRFVFRRILIALKHFHLHHLCNNKNDYYDNITNITVCRNIAKCQGYFQSSIAEQKGRKKGWG